MFLKLIDVKGLGPKMALPLLSVDSSELMREIENGNIKIEISIINNSNHELVSNDIMQSLAGRKDIASISLNKLDKSIISDEEEF